MLRQRSTGLRRSMEAAVTIVWVALAMLAGTSAAWAQSSLVEDALRAAQQTFELALLQLDAVTMGVPVDEYREALTQQQFASSMWHLPLKVELVTNSSDKGLCAGFAAYVTPAVDHNLMSLVLCPRFFTPGADSLRQTTILHEMVHVVAGPNECQAMAFTAHVQLLATGTFQPVRDYWSRNNCDASRYRLPG